MTVHRLGDRPHPSVRQTVQRPSSEGHLTFILMEAMRCRDLGDRSGERTNLLHAVFCAATEGRGRLSDQELTELLNQLGPFDAVPGGGE